METLQLFTGLLLAVCAVHLVFSGVEVIDRWLAKNFRHLKLSAKSKREISRSDWYVFFDCADLFGRESKSKPAKSSRNYNGTTSQQRRRSVGNRL